MVQKLLVILLIALTSCSQPQQYNKTIIVSEKSTIVAFGNSLTVGVGASEGFDYPTLLSQKLGMPIINAGVSGEVSAQALGRIDVILEEYYPHVVILLHGGNDILRKLNLAQTKQNLSLIIEKIESSGAKVVLIGVPKPGIFLRTATFYTQLAQQYRLVYLHNDLAHLFGDNRYKSDNIHLSDQGYQKLADALAQYFKVVD